MSTLTQRDLNWFRLANSNPQNGFYPFKDRFLRRFAKPDGYDLQIIDLRCRACYGSGNYTPTQTCFRCGGSGIYDTKKVWLIRYDLDGWIYHKPDDYAYTNNGYSYPTPKNEIEGRIKHGDVPQAVARRAFYRLLIRHEPATFYAMIVERWKSKMLCFRSRLAWKLIRLRNKMDLFPAVEDEIPF